MSGSDVDAAKMLRAAVVVISSKILSGREPDGVRQGLERALGDVSAEIVAYEVVPDDRKAIRDQLMRLCDEQGPDLILTVGGTGVRPSDWAPEATRDIVDKEIPGIGEAMRLESLKKVRTAMLSRGTAGIRGKSLIVNLPGSAKGVKENLGVLEPILHHTVEKIQQRS